MSRLDGTFLGEYNEFRNESYPNDDDDDDGSRVNIRVGLIKSKGGNS